MKLSLNSLIIVQTHSTSPLYPPLYLNTFTSMRLPIALSHLGTGGSGGRVRSVRVDAALWKLENNKRDCVSDDDTSDDDSMTLSSTTKPSNKRKSLVDCYVLVGWSELEKLVKERMVCASCGMAVTAFVQQTVGIATEVNFSCSNCNQSQTAVALRSEYVVQTTAASEYQCKQWIDYYELNWRIIMATRLLGESLTGGWFHLRVNASFKYRNLQEQLDADGATARSRRSPNWGTNRCMEPIERNSGQGSRPMRWRCKIPVLRVV
jgi:hypothetical protein